MRRTPPQNKVDKLASPRVTLRLHQVKSRDEKKPPQSKPEIPTHDSRVQFTVKMDAGVNKVDDIYEFKSNKDSTPARGTSTTPDADKSSLSSKLTKEAEMRESLGAGINADQHASDGNTREEKMKSVEVEIGKRSHSEANDGEDGDDETRRKKRREDRPENSKDVNRNSSISGRPQGRGLTSDRCPKGAGISSKNSSVASTVGGKVGSGNSGSSGGNTPTDRKSPNATASPGASPMPTRVGAESGESEGEDGRRGEGGAGIGGPKVPPLKIVIPQQNTSGAEGSDQGGRNNGKNGGARHHHHHPALPYVVSSGGSGDQERTETSSASLSIATGTVTVAISSQPSSTTTSECGAANRDSLQPNNMSGSKGDEKKDQATLSEERSQRVLRSSHRMASMHSSVPMPPNPPPPSSTASTLSPGTATTTSTPPAPVSSAPAVPNGPPNVAASNPPPAPNPPEPIPDSAPSTSSSPILSSGPSCPVKAEEKPTPTSVPSSSSVVGSSSGSGGEEQIQRQSPALQQPMPPSSQGQLQVQPPQQTSQQMPQSQQQPPVQQQQPQQQQQQQQQQSSTSNVDVHPRKRKLKKESADPTMDVPSGTVSEVHPHDQPITNCYELFLNIRKQIERRRKGLFPVQPKPPQGFKDYLMNRCTYVLAGNATSRLSVPITPPPQSLQSPMKELFQEQEKERYRLRMQHVIEKEKLVLSVEQEILRVHGRAARALANQALPFSACTILKDEEVYNVITPEQEEKDRNARSRYNGRLFLSWLQDVDDKWEKIKEAMLLRHHNEAESLHAVQKMDWEWKLKELALCETKNKPVIDEHHVPMVHVSDDFDLLPA